MTRPHLGLGIEAGWFALFMSVLLGCEVQTRSASQPRYPAPAPPPPGQYPSGQYPSTPVQAGQAQPYQTVQQSAPQTASPPANSYPVATDPINNLDTVWLRNRAQAMYQELIQALPAGPQSRIAAIPLVLDQQPNDVNAFATCTTSGKALIVVTDGLVDVMAHLAQCRATDEIFGTNKTDEYIHLIASTQKPNSPVVRPPLGFFNVQQLLDSRKVARQHLLFDEETGFVIGHEMGHHYLGHLPCTAPSAGGLSAAEIGMVFSSALPLFNQPNEIAADNGGTKNVLAAGTRRGDYHYTESGALLVMQFFAGIDQWSPTDILFPFEQSHPPPQGRSLVIQGAASLWRSSGGVLPPVF